MEERVVRVKIVRLRIYLLVVHSPVSPLRVNGNKRYYIVAYRNIIRDACDGSVQFIVQQMDIRLKICRVIFRCRAIIYTPVFVVFGWKNKERRILDIISFVCALRLAWLMN